MTHEIACLKGDSNFREEVGFSGKRFSVSNCVPRNSESQTGDLRKCIELKKGVEFLVSFAKMGETVQVDRKTSGKEKKLSFFDWFIL
jgi:hypothetical protein